MQKPFRMLLAVVGACLAVAAFSGCPKGEFQDGLGLKVKLDWEQRQLPNGLTVAMIENHSVPLVTYQTWYRVGSVDERLGRTGISHLFEHLMFNGTERFPDKPFFRLLEAKGAEVNAGTTRDYTVFYQSFTPALIDQVIELEADRMANLKLTETALNTERAIVFEERRLRTDNDPSGKVNEALWALAFRRHPYGWPVVGYPDDLLAVTTEDLGAYFEKHYAPSNAVIVIVGDFDREKTWEKIRKAYGGIAKRPQPKRDIPDEPEYLEERRFILRDEVSSESLSWGYRITAASDDDSYALDVLANVLFAGTSSRAHRKLVEEKNIALGVSGLAFTPTYPGLFIINAAMRAGVKGETAERELEGLIREVQENGVTDDEIRVAVRQLTMQLVDGMRTPQGLAQFVGTLFMVLGDPKRFQSDLEKYLRVTRSDVRRVAEKYLIPNRRAVVTLVPGESK